MYIFFGMINFIMKNWYFGRCVPVLLMIAVLLSGCHGKDREAQRALRDSGIAKLTQGDYAGAGEDFSAAMELSGGRVSDAEIDLCYYEAACYALEEQYDKAVSRYTDLLTYDSGNAYAYYLRGSAYLDMEEDAKGLADYRVAAAKAPEDYELAIAIYQNLQAFGHKKESSEFLNRALEIDGDGADNFYYRGRIYLLLGQDDLAKTAFLRAMDEGNDEAGIYLAQAFVRDGDKKSAKELIARYTGKDESDARQSVLTGRLLLELGEYKQALAVYDKALAADEEGRSEYRPELLRGQISAYEFSGNFKKALAAAQDYVAAYPSDAGMIREVEFLKTR